MSVLRRNFPVKIKKRNFIYQRQFKKEKLDGTRVVLRCEMRCEALHCTLFDVEILYKTLL